MEADGFLIKYINLMRCDQPLNSLPFIFFCAIFAFVEANVTIAIIVEPENSEKILIAVADIMVCTLVASLTVFRSLNPENSFQLAELIEEDLCGWHDWRVGKNSINLKIEIEDYYAEKKKQTKTMNNNIAYSFSVLFVLVENRNIINYLSRTPTSQFETTGWPTPFLSYCPLYLKSEIFFIYTYILHSFLVLCYMVEGFYVITTTYLSTEKIIIVCDTISILANHLAIDFPDGDDLKRNGGDLNKNEECLKKSKEYLKEDGENFGMNREDLGNSEKDLDKSRGDLKMREDFKGREKYLENSYSREQNLRQDMGRIVYCHQKVNRNFRKFDHSSRLLMTISNLLVMLYSCALAYLVLTTDDLMKGINFAVLFVCLNLTMFVAHHNGQRLFNQNDILRRTLAELPWTDKPQWFKQTLHIMMTRANVDIEMRPYGIFSLNYLSFKDLMKTAFSIGNIFYTKKLTSQA